MSSSFPIFSSKNSQEILIFGNDKKITLSVIYAEHSYTSKEIVMTQETTNLVNAIKDKQFDFSSTFVWQSEREQKSCESERKRFVLYLLLSPIYAL